MNAETLDAVHRAAKEAYAAGLWPRPASGNGNKKPWTADGTWGEHRLTPAILRNLYPGRQSLGIETGHDGIEAMDFDDRATYEHVRRAAEDAGLLEVLNRIESGYCDDTPGGGVRWLYRCPQPDRNLKLARRPIRPDERTDAREKIKVLIETRGTGGFAIVAPSNGNTHPSGRPYVRRSGSFNTIAALTTDERAALFDLLRSFDELPKPDEGGQPRATKSASGTRPGDDFCARVTWSSVLEPHGWRSGLRRGEVQHWTRPGKKFGTSATTNTHGSDLFYVFSSSTEFEPERGYTKFAAYAILEYGGDFSAAARALGARGYGNQTPAARPPRPGTNGQTAPETGPITETAPSPRLQLTPLGDLLAEPDDQVEWLVDDRIPYGSLILLAGKPKAGKSTAARDLAFAVATGGWWLGHRCQRGTVWYLALEEKRSEVKRHFKQMGATGSEPIRVFIDQAPADLVRQLWQLAEKERPALIIIDTMARFLQARDLNDYSEITAKLDPVIHLARTTGAALVLLHHASKAPLVGQDAILGSTALAGSVDNILLLTRADRYRLLSTVQRIGPDLAETVVMLSDAGRVELGALRREADLSHIQTSMLEALSNASGPLTREALMESIEARKGLKLEALKNIVAVGTVIRTGRGTKTDPYQYVLPLMSDSGSQVPLKRAGT